MSLINADLDSLNHVTGILHAHVGHLLEAERFDALVDELVAAAQ